MARTNESAPDVWSELVCFRRLPFASYAQSSPVGWNNACWTVAVVTRRRRSFLNLVFAGLLVGSAYDVVTGTEHWPFSPYPMFAGTWRSPTFSWLRLFGVTADGAELALESNDYIQPFDQSRLAKALRQLMDEPDGSERIRIALADCLTRYDELRADGGHDGPPLTALRLYELEWAIDPAAIDVNRPIAKRFIAEVRRR